MSESGTSARPRQLTMAGWFVIIGSVFLLLSVFDTLAGLNSVDTRDQVADALASPTGKGLGLGVEDALVGMRVALSVAAVCAAIAAVLGVFVLQRHHGARIALSVIAVPILLTAPLTGGLVGALIAAATLMLWSGPARDWFAGRPVRDTKPLFAPRQRDDRERGGWPPAQDHGRDGSEENRPEHEPPGPTPTRPEPDPEEPATPPADAVSTDRPSEQPPQTRGFGSTSAHGDSGERPDLWSAYPDPGPAGPPGSHPASGPGPSMPGPWPHSAPRSQSVPGPVKMACILTWVFAGVVALLYTGILLVLLVAQDRIVDVIVDTPAWAQANVDRDLLVPVLWMGSLMFLGWTLSALVLAWFTWRRHEWARYLLAASAAAGLVAATFAFPAGLAHQIACAATIWGLFSAPARAWFSGRRPQGPPGGGHPAQQGSSAPPPTPPPARYQDRPGPW